MKSIIIVLLLALLTLSPKNTAALAPSVGDVTDNRTTGQFFGRLEMELKLIGDEIGDADAVRLSLKKVVDDTGKDILNPEKIENGFKDLNEFGTKGNSVKFELKNPSRKAAAIQELTGTIEMFIPKNDPNAVVTIPNFLAKTGKPFAEPALKQANVELTITTVAQEKELKQKALEAQKAEAKKQGMSPEAIASLGEMFDMGGGDNENSLNLKLSDPNNKLVAFTLTGPDGKEIRNNGSMTSNGLKTLYFSEKIPETATLTLKLATPKSVVAMPINMTNIPLP